MQRGILITLSSLRDAPVNWTPAMSSKGKNTAAGTFCQDEMIKKTFEKENPYNK